ncbi:hypothetical protein [Akkermansia sp. AKK6]
MTYSIETIKEEIKNLSSKEFYLKYIHCSNNWYFENILNIPVENIVEFDKEFKKIISENFELEPNSVEIVGSGKLGCSLTPFKDKIYKEFDIDRSDIDVAVISPRLFDQYWVLLRKSYKPLYNGYYERIPQAIYRGYINEKCLLHIDGCRKYWYKSAGDSKKVLHAKLYIQHEVTYRIYRKWKDFEDYHISSIEKIKRGKLKKQNTETRKKR